MLPVKTIAIGKAVSRLSIDRIESTQNIEDIFFNKCLSDLLADPDDDLLLMTQYHQHQNALFAAQMALQSTSVVKINKFMEHVVARYSTQQFQENFRLTRVSFEYVLNEIRLVFPVTVGPGRSQILLEKQLLSVLWLLATPESYRYVEVLLLFYYMRYPCA